MWPPVSTTVIVLMVTGMIIVSIPQIRSCHIIAKGIAATLRENMCFKDKNLRKSMNQIIHCPFFKRTCKENQRHHLALLHPECLQYMAQSGMYEEILNLRKP